VHQFNQYEAKQFVKVIL